MIRRVADVAGVAEQAVESRAGKQVDVLRELARVARRLHTGAVIADVQIDEQPNLDLLAQRGSEHLDAHLRIDGRPHRAVLRECDDAGRALAIDDRVRDEQILARRPQRLGLADL